MLNIESLSDCLGTPFSPQSCQVTAQTTGRNRVIVRQSIQDINEKTRFLRLA